MYEEPTNTEVVKICLVSRCAADVDVELHLEQVINAGSIRPRHPHILFVPRQSGSPAVAASPHRSA